MHGESTAVSASPAPLAGAATYLSQDGLRTVFTQPRYQTGEDRAEQLKRDPDKLTGNRTAYAPGHQQHGGTSIKVHALP
jgi:hypothetical protein